MRASRPRSVPAVVGITHGVDLLTSSLVGVPSGTSLTVQNTQPNSGGGTARHFQTPPSPGFWQVSGGTYTNCRFTGTTIVNGSGATFNNCTFDGNVSISSSSAVTLYRCLGINASDLSDISGDNPLGSVCTGIVMTECLFNNPAPGAGDHCDGLQIHGVNGFTATRCAWDLGPWFQIGGQDVLNAAVFPDADPTFGGHKNMLFDNCYVNGGGYALYLRPGPAVNAVTDNNRYRNLYVGTSSNFGQVQLDANGTPVEWSAFSYPSMTPITL